MSKMNHLSLSIQEVAKDDHKLSRSMTNEIQQYLAGKREFSELSWKSQYAVEISQANNDDAIACNEGRFSFDDFLIGALRTAGMIAIALLLVNTSAMASPRMYKHHSKGAGHYHKSNIHAPKTWNIGNPLPQHWTPIETD